jgi:sterol desaturase/sphingolipid hydroxylase (fatty acid hydroxylase superfamily)
VLDHADPHLPARIARLSTHWSARHDTHRSRYRVNFGSIMPILDTLFHRGSPDRVRALRIAAAPLHF